MKWQPIQGSGPRTEAIAAVSGGVPGPLRIGVAAAFTLVGIALGARTLWLILLADAIPLSRGAAYAALMALASLALVAAARALLGAADPAPDAAGKSRPRLLHAAAAGAALIASLAALGGLSYWLGRVVVEGAVQQRLEAVATLNVSLIETWATDVRNDIDIWSRDPILGSALERARIGNALAEASGPAQSPELRRLAKTWRYTAVTVRDPVTAVPWLSTRDEPDSEDSRRQALAIIPRLTAEAQSGLALKGMNDPAGAPVQLSFFRLVTLPAHARRALLQVDIAVDESPLRSSKAAGPDTRAADLVLVPRDADAAVIIGGSRARAPGLPLSQRALDSGSVWTSIRQAGNGGFARGTDAGGQRVLAFARPIAGAEWLLVTLIGEETMIGEFNRVFVLTAALADALLTIGIWWWMLYRRQAARESRMQLERIRHAEEVAELSRRVVSAQEDERHRLAMELHDRAAANLATIKLNLKGIAKLAPDGAQTGSNLVQESSELLSDTIVSIREFCAGLRPAQLDYAGLAAALRSAAAQFEARTGICAECDDRDFNFRCDAALELALYRIVQEALVNCAKHSGAGHVRILIAVRDGLLLLEVVDDGSGFDPKSLCRSEGRVGNGLLNMRDRAAFAGGALTVEPVPGGGTRVRFSMPWRTPQMSG